MCVCVCVRVRVRVRVCMRTLTTILLTTSYTFLYTRWRCMQHALGPKSEVTKIFGNHDLDFMYLPAHFFV